MPCFSRIELVSLSIELWSETSGDYLKSSKVWRKKLFELKQKHNKYIDYIFSIYELMFLSNVITQIFELWSG